MPIRNSLAVAVVFIAALGCSDTQTEYVQSPLTANQFEVTVQPSDVSVNSVIVPAVVFTAVEHTHGTDTSFSGPVTVALAQGLGTHCLEPRR